MADPNPAVAGRGFEALRQAGIEVQTGVDEQRARELNEDFAQWIRTGLPFVTLKIRAHARRPNRRARPASRTPITGEAAREAVQRLRHSADALLTGIGTVLVDDPLLTDRTGVPRRRKLLRVVLDSRLRLPLKSRVVRSAEAQVLVFTTEAPNSRRRAHSRKRGVEIVRTRNRRGRV